jgi:hypothetical protein
MDENQSLADQFGLVQRDGFVPETMIVVGSDFGLGEGTPGCCAKVKNRSG